MGSGAINTGILSSGYHTWACEWTNTHLTFYFDGVKTRTVYYPIGGSGDDGWGNAPKGHIMLNLAAGVTTTDGKPGWPGYANDKNAFPATLAIDYLKIYEKTDGVVDPPTEIPTFTLENNKWRIITLPADPGSNNTVDAIFGDDIPGQIRTDWAVYAYNANKGEYDSYGKFATLKPGIGYWIIQKSGVTKVIDMPAGSTAITAAHHDAYLFNKSGATTWNMVGNPYANAISTANIRIKTGNGICASGCDLNTANSNDIVANQLFSFDGTKYITHTPSSAATLNPWIGFWAASLKNAASAGGSFIQFYKSTGAKPATTKVSTSSSLKNISPPQALTNDLELNSFFATSSISPNPSKGIFNFNFSSDYKGNINIKVFSIDGRLVEDLNSQKTTKNFTHQINLSNKASGIYIMNFEAGEYHSNHQIIKN